MTDSLTAHPADATTRRRWIALICISIAQLMVIFDASIMNIALPQAQLDLAFSDADRQVGTALMSTIAAGATAAWLETNRTATSAAADQAAVHGYVTVFWWAAGALVLAAATSFALVRSTRPSDPAADGSSTDSAASLAHY